MSAARSWNLVRTDWLANRFVPARSLRLGEFRSAPSDIVALRTRQPPAQSVTSDVGETVAHQAAGRGLFEDCRSQIRASVVQLPGHAGRDG